MATPLLFAIVLLVWVVGTIAIGARVAAVGWFGRPVFRGPSCAGCGQGIAARPGASAVACAECGADLGREHAVRYFARVRSPRTILLGAAIVASSVVAPFAVRLAVSAVGRGSAPAPLGPNASVAQLAGSIAADEPDAESAIGEAIRRVRDRQLSDADLRTLVEAIRSRAASPASAKRGEVDLLLEARSRDLIDDEVLLAFGRREVNPPRLLFSTTFRSPRVIEILDEPQRGFGRFQFASILTALRLDDEAVPIVDVFGKPLAQVGPQEMGRATLRGEPGQHSLHRTYAETFTFAPDILRTLAGRTVAGTRTVTTPVRILAEDDPTWVTLHSPPDRRAEVDAACRCTGVAFDCPPEGQTCVLRAMFNVSPTPGVSVAFEVVVQLDDEEYVVGQMVIVSTPTMNSIMGPIEMPVEIPRPAGPLPTKANVLFRPAPALAEPFHGAERVWGEVIERRDLPVHTNVPSGGQATGQPTGQPGGAR